MAAYARLGGMNYAGAHLCFSDICARYELAGRFYHNLDHLHGVVSRITSDQNTTSYGDTYHDVAILAALYHDAEYIPGDHLNEEKSAGLALTQLKHLGLSTDHCSYMASAIRMTADYANVRIVNPNKVDSLLATADLQPLGREYDVFKRNCDAVLMEHGIWAGAGNKETWTAGMVKHLNILQWICHHNPHFVDVGAVQANIAKLALALLKP